MTPFIDRFIADLENTEHQNSGGLEMPFIGSLDTLKPNDILIVTKRDDWPEFRKTQTFSADTPQHRVYKALNGWNKVTPCNRRITTIGDFLSNPSNPRPYRFQEAKEYSFIPLDFDL